MRQPPLLPLMLEGSKYVLNVSGVHMGPPQLRQDIFFLALKLAESASSGTSGPVTLRRSGLTGQRSWQPLTCVASQSTSPDTYSTLLITEQVGRNANNKVLALHQN